MLGPSRSRTRQSRLRSRALGDQFTGGLRGGRGAAGHSGPVVSVTGDSIQVSEHRLVRVENIAHPFERVGDERRGGSRGCAALLLNGERLGFGVERDAGVQRWVLQRGA